MIGTFIILAIVFVLRLVAQSLLPSYDWLASFIPYMNYALWGALGLFAVFVIIAIVKAINK